MTVSCACTCACAVPQSRQGRKFPSASISPLLHTESPQHILTMTDSKVPQPGPAKLKRNAGPDEWLEAAKDCKYLSEAHMKQLCEMVKEYMMEGRPLTLPIQQQYPEHISNQIPQNQTSNLSPHLLPFAAISTASSTICWSSSVFLVGCPMVLGLTLHPNPLLRPPISSLRLRLQIPS